MNHTIKENKMFYIFLIAVAFLVAIFISVLTISTINMIQDHNCYIGEETREEMCRRYR